ncbi:aryl-alcohol dehydrogenase-like predicted oxidoreductase [Kitasatospora gansuensis]|uniref:Aryl-alcohol dehydrogenase-like predicted oxidoreductase n=1 Tax=Kitasatospora gansuensis TaxID=258050 RepID=A0A7W7WJZ8_9ACTN|nr:aldo/keto reductase [Kitasatospora gansuensis]MBB4950292.1 aryl-alcohol dehydrogenase-like predicted oxidoreductase [Kitasatospora gansuensis]
MRTTKLGVDGPEVGVIGLGCMGMTWAYDPNGRDDTASVEVLRSALDLGVTLIDTADVYGPYDNEELVGKGLACEYRERAVLATKVGLVQGKDGARVGNDGRPEHVRRSIDDSLRRLGTDHVDLYQLHRVDPAVPLEETWGAMAEAVAAGKARRLGLSEVTVEQIQRAQAVHPVASVQSELSLWTRDALAEVVPYTEANGIAFLPFSPLGRGFLAGRFSSAADIPADDWRSTLPRFQADALAANQALVDTVRRIADQYGATPAQVALAWVVAQGQYVVPIPGTKTPKYLVDNAGAADLTLTAADLAELDALPAPVGGRY